MPSRRQTRYIGKMKQIGHMKRSDENRLEKVMMIYGRTRYVDR